MTALAEMGTLREILVRPASTSDRALLRAMYEGFEPRPASLGLPPRQGLDQWLEKLNGTVDFVAVSGGEVVGHAVLCPDGDAGEVAVFVRQEYRVQGIGSRLLKTVVEEARRLGLRIVWGMTERDNVPMLRLAHGVGFEQDEKDPYRFQMNLKPDLGLGG
ncbi:MAG TPA: GNAT family N-acetyltransferase [Patescibacteria group bacterium]|nr:GNAT family N-acetyltransferase [Patescibacteria group bacterium]